MYRSAIEQLKSWKDAHGRMPLLLVGARQVGKTWLLKTFGRECFASIAYLSFDTNPALAGTLESTVSPQDILPLLAAETKTAIRPGETLIVFDEIQTCPRALTSLKYFCEEAPEYHVVAAGSTLGVMLHEQSAFPVGKVSFMDIFPMSFDEFLRALGEEELAAFVRDGHPETFRPLHEKLLRLLKEYIYVGGMPAAVAIHANNRTDFAAVRSVQETILRAYDRDFSKYATPLFATKLRQVWNSIPSQLSKENRRFTYAAIRKSARGKDFAAAIRWLEDSSMIASVHRVVTPAHPLKSYEDENAFKLFANDVGLLSAMADLSVTMLAAKNDLFVEFKGALAEQFAFQELRQALNKPLYYWSKENSSVNIDFLVQDSEGRPTPIEIKSGVNLASKSLMIYVQKWKPHRSYRASLADYKVDEKNNIVDIPLYAIGKIIPDKNFGGGAMQVFV
jgi:predicted AAA+ superfamily ATPase